MDTSISLTAKATALLLGCSEGQLSDSNRRRWKVKGSEVWTWAVYDENDRVMGYNVPTDVFEAIMHAKRATVDAAPEAPEAATVPFRSRIRTRTATSNSGNVPYAHVRSSADDARFERYFEDYEGRFQRTCDAYEARIERQKDEIDAIVRREREAHDKYLALTFQHQTERLTLAAEHQREVADLKDEVRDLKAQLRIEEAGAGGETAWERILDTDAAQSLFEGLGVVLQTLGHSSTDATGAYLSASPPEGGEAESGEGDGASTPNEQPNPTNDGDPGVSLFRELLDLVALEDGDAFAARVMAAVTGSEVPFRAWAGIGHSIIGHIFQAGWDPTQLALFALPLLGVLPATYRSLAPAELAGWAQQFVGLSAEEAALVQAALEAAYGS